LIKYSNKLLLEQIGIKIFFQKKSHLMKTPTYAHDFTQLEEVLLSQFDPELLAESLEKSLYAIHLKKLAESVEVVS